MPLASAVAAELIRLAEGLNTIPDVVMPHVFLSLSHPTKESFIACARIIPRPLVKSIQYPDKEFSELRLAYRSEAMILLNSVPQSLTCIMVEPAKPAVYRCEPILSPEEDAELESK